PIVVPRLGWSMDEGSFVEWLRRDGDSIQPGDPLFVLESDKATQNIEALDAGVLRIGPEGPNPGDSVAVGPVVAYLVAVGQTLPLGGAVTGDVVKAKESVASARELMNPQDAAPAVRPAYRRRTASPRARRVAAELGIDWRTLQGSGGNGRVRERDVRLAARDSQPK